MRLHLFTHPLCLEHSAGPGHPERPERLSTLLNALGGPRWDDLLERTDAPESDRSQLLRVHPEAYLEALEKIHVHGGGRLDPDTAMNEFSWPAALRASGGAAAAARTAVERREPAFAAVRPPGHHAEAQRAMGFCLLSNVVIAAREALSMEDVRQVLIVDWDVHHGNGTQSLVEEDPSIRYVSLHQWPYYPGTGGADELGVGNIFNVPMRAGLQPDAYRDGLLGAIEKALFDWSPDLILVSAGFDAMAGDPLAGFTLHADDFGVFTRRLRGSGAPIAGVLEGGYHLENLAHGTAAFLEALL